MRFRFGLYLCALASIASAAGAPTTLAEGQNRFGLELFQVIRLEPGNLFFSPFSLATALGLTAKGARGKTREEMDNVLHRPVDAAGQTRQFLTKLNAPGRLFELSTANGLWLQSGFPIRAEFLGTARDSYGAEVRTLDFAKAPEPSRRTINHWVEEHTRSRIKDLIPGNGITPLTRLVLTNAVYFKGQWATAFPKASTRNGSFFLSKDQPIPTPLMDLGSAKSLRYFENEEFQSVELPYQGEDLAMIVFLPRPGMPLARWEESLTAENLARWLDSAAPTQVRVILPRFKSEFTKEMSDPLIQLGMRDAFLERRADFGGIRGRNDLFIAKVFHKSWADVNEEGTEAAAATAVVMQLRGVMTPEPEPKLFRADRPFVYLIRHRPTGAILFLGRLVNPRG